VVGSKGPTSPDSGYRGTRQGYAPHMAHSTSRPLIPEVTAQRAPESAGVPRQRRRDAFTLYAEVYALRLDLDDDDT
jgi:hypothetical protein